MWTVHHNHGQAAVADLENEFVPKVGLAASLGEELPGAANVAEGRNLVTMLEKKVGGPCLRVQVETRSGQSPPHGFDYMGSTGRHVSADQSYDRLGDLEDDWVIGRASQEPGSLQTAQLCLCMGGRVR